jgi:hypothetical protein
MSFCFYASLDQLFPPLSNSKVKERVALYAHPLCPRVDFTFTFLYQFLTPLFMFVNLTRVYRVNTSFIYTTHHLTTFLSFLLYVSAAKSSLDSPLHCTQIRCTGSRRRSTVTFPWLKQNLTDTVQLWQDGWWHITRTDVNRRIKSSSHDDKCLNRDEDYVESSGRPTQLNVARSYQSLKQKNALVIACLTKHKRKYFPVQATKACRKSRGIAPLTQHRH